MSKQNQKKAPRYGTLLPKQNARNGYTNTRFNRVTDPVVISAFASPPAQAVLTTDGSGNGTLYSNLAPRGFEGIDPVVGTKATIVAPHLPWMYSTSLNFGAYRVLRANLIVTGIAGSTTTGTVTVKSSTDTADVSQNSVVTSVGGTSFELATLANKNRSIPLEIDTSWKKITTNTMVFDTGIVYSVNTTNDLCFTNFNINVVGGPATTKVVNLYVEYDVEFKNPMALGYNA